MYKVIRSMSLIKPMPKILVSPPEILQAASGKFQSRLFHTSDWLSDSLLSGISNTLTETLPFVLIGVADGVMKWEVKVEGRDGKPKGNIAVTQDKTIPRDMPAPDGQDGRIRKLFTKNIIAVSISHLMTWRTR